EDALAVAHSLSDAGHRNLVLVDVIAALGRTGKASEALALVDDLTDARYRCRALVGLAGVARRPDLVRDALAAALAIEDDMYGHARDDALLEVATALAHRGEVERAFEAVLAMKSGLRRDQAAGRVAAEAFARRYDALTEVLTGGSDFLNRRTVLYLFVEMSTNLQERFGSNFVGSLWRRLREVLRWA